MEKKEFPLIAHNTSLVMVMAMGFTAPALV